MEKKEIKEFFKAISSGDLPKVSSLIYTNGDYINVCNYSSPKKHDGQSGLQLAFKTGNFAIARLLIENGADVNFIETSTINEWSAPVLHDCIRSVIFNSYTLQKDTTKFDEALSILKLMLSKKADPNAIDSYDNNCLHRAILDSRQMIDHPAADLTSEILLDQLKSVFDALISAGADVNQVSDNRPSALSFIKNFMLEKYDLL